MIDNVKDKLNRTKKYLDKLETELVMANRNDGWYNNWLGEKISELKITVNKYKHKFND